ncbi:hypothetical protein M0802_014181 [Mischocyttarus mexicanus]|nr:hypothetical protein M0802_014310 [Mischocyttarus mexicanus]KAI4480490.1 hypothetical protein M0802_014181 [Mischocyttarus mexicanus]
MLLRLLWHFYINETSVDKAAQWCLVKRVFRHPEVCFVTTHYWYQRFSTNFCYPQCFRTIDIYKPYIQIEVLTALKSLYPHWNIFCFMDAIKVSKDTIKWYFHNLSNKKSSLFRSDT